MIGLRQRSICWTSAPNMSEVNASTKDFSDISLMSAPAAKAFSEPVSTMQRTFSFSSAAFSALESSPSKLRVERVHRVGAVQLDQGDMIFDLDDQRLIGHAAATPAVLGARRVTAQALREAGLAPPALGSSYLWQIGQ
jgi:hypothetical protein